MAFPFARTLGAALAAVCIAAPALAQGERESGGFNTRNLYIRGEIGYGFGVGSDVNDRTGLFVPFALDANTGRSLAFGVGAGYRFLPWLRGDVTYTYRGGFAASGDLLPVMASRRSHAFMFNAYVDVARAFNLDLGVFEPFIGGGIGFALNTAANPRVAIGPITFGFDTQSTTTSFAWNIGIGTGIRLTPGLLFDVGYRYVDLGHFESRTNTFIFIPGINFRGSQEAHEIYAGLRYEFGGGQRGPNLSGSMPSVFGDGRLYLRGDVGFSFGDEANSSISGVPLGLHGQTGTSLAYGAGVGYRFLDWLRGEFTYTYRNGFAFDAPLLFINTRADRIAHAFMFNANIDVARALGMNLGVFEPYVSAGLGFSVNRIENERVALGPIAFGLTGHTTDVSFAWQLGLGTGIRVAPNLLFDIGYRYVDLGDSRTQSRNIFGFTLPEFRSSQQLHELYAGLRYEFGAGSPPPANAPEMAMGINPRAFYVRADVGYGFGTSTETENAGLIVPSGTRGDTGNSLAFGLGLGARFNQWLRGDITYTYRNGFGFDATPPTGLPFTLHVQSNRRSHAFMVNAYAEVFRALGWDTGIFSPYIGGGIGFAVNTVSGGRLSALGISVGFDTEETTTSFAWNIGAGTGVRLTPNLVFDASYRYVDLGRMSRGPVNLLFITAPDLESSQQAHEINLGLRYEFGASDRPSLFGGSMAGGPSRFYIRADIAHGWGSETTSDVSGTGVGLSGQTGTSLAYGGGVGYRFLDWLRGEVTYTYRGGYVFDAPFVITNIRSERRSHAFMVNAHVDVARAAGVDFGMFEPYVSAGVGVAVNRVDSQRASFGPIFIGLSGDTTRASFAWQLGFGTGIRLSRNMVLDLGYRYVDLGTARTNSTNIFGLTLPEFRSSQQSHEVGIGFRFEM